MRIPSARPVGFGPKSRHSELMRKDAGSEELSVPSRRFRSLSSAEEWKGEDVEIQEMSTRSGMRVGFDLDGVLYDFRRVFSEYLQSKGQLECGLDSASSGWDFFEGWGMTSQKFLEMYRQGVDEGYVLTVGQPLPGVVAEIGRLKEAGHSVHIVTDRFVASDPNRPAKVTNDWLIANGIQFDSLTLSGDKTVASTDFFIDDKYENYVARVRAGMSCHLLDRPWNRKQESCQANRVRSVSEFVDIVLELGRTNGIAVPGLRRTDN